MVRVAIGSAIHHFSLFHSRPVAIDTASPAYVTEVWKSEKWWIALPIATRTIDRYPLEPRRQRAGSSLGAAYTRAWAGVCGG
jgi:hypothetical protein